MLTERRGALLVAAALCGVVATAVAAPAASAPLPASGDTASASPVADVVPATAPAPRGYDELVALYEEFRRLVVPSVVDGVPDYSPAAIERQARALAQLRTRLAAIDDRAWPIEHRADHLLVLAEMRGLEFNHRVLQPWRKDPAFYSTTNLGFGPKMHGAFAVPTLPLSADAAAKLGANLRNVPAILERARANLTDARGDLARLAIAQKAIERNVYERLAQDAKRHHPELVAPAERARDATAKFQAWLEEIAPRLPQHGGVGREHYDWYLRHVLLFPYTWEEIRTIGEREYQRSLVFLKLEEHRNRATPMPQPLATLDEFMRRQNDADADLLAFLERQNVMTVPEFLKPPGEGPYILPEERDPSRPGLFDPPVNPHFFFQASFRDPRPLRAHNVPGHYYDGLLRERDRRPIRGQPRLFFVDGIRVEGWAFYLEEMTQQVGFLEQRPKTREINYILQTKRAARVLPELMMHANEWLYEDALESLTTRTPTWMGPRDPIARFDIELYLRQPGYGVGYYLGKVELEKLFADVAAARGSKFDLKAFHDEFLAAGRVPISLIRWQMTGRDDEIAKMR